MTERLLFPFGVYDTNRCAMCWIGLYENEAACWETWLGWPTKEEIDYAKANGQVVLPLTVNYQPPPTKHQPVRILEHGDEDGGPDGGSFEVRFNNGRPSKFFPWRDKHREKALEDAKTFARAERDKINAQNQKEPLTK